MRSTFAQRTGGAGCRNPPAGLKYETVGPFRPAHLSHAGFSTSRVSWCTLRTSSAAVEAAEAQLADAPAASTPTAEQQPAPQQRTKQPARQRNSADASGKSDAIIVQDKPVRNALLRRLEAVPEAVLRASRPDDATTYKALTAVASAQTKLAASGKVVVYVPYTKASKFTAQLVTASAAITDRITEPPLVVKASTDAAMLGNTLAFELVKHGGATLCSAGASASSKAAEALRVARSQVLRKGYEIGVVPQFVAGVGARGSEITILKQQVVLQQLPAPEVVAPSSSKKPVDAAAAAAATMLQRQRRCTLQVPQKQLQRATELVYKITHSQGRAAPDRPAPAAAVVVGDTLVQDQAGKPRLLLVSYSGTTPRSSVQPAKPAADAADAGAASPEASAAEVAAAEADAVPAAPASSASDDAANALVGLRLMPTRFTSIPEPRWGLAGPDGPIFAKKPVVATAESTVGGLAGALENKLARLGAAWLYSDGTEVGNRAAWQAYVAAAKKLSGKADKGSVLALVRVDQAAAKPSQQPAVAPATDAGAAAADAQSGQQQAEAGDSSSSSSSRASGSASAGYSLSMLLAYDDDICRSLLQAPNAPLESSKVGQKQALQLIKFAAAVNSFLPVSDTTGAGGLVILPAVLSADQTGSESAAAVDYRFASSSKPRYDYFFRLQRYTQELPGGIDGPEVQTLRVSVNTDPGKLRDALVAKMLQSQPATLRFVSSAGKLPGFMLSIAMTAVAAARVRLQSKQATVDLGVMPMVLQAPTQAPAEGGAAAAADDSQQRVMYSLRLVPMPAAAVDVDPAL